MYGSQPQMPMGQSPMGMPPATRMMPPGMEGMGMRMPPGMEGMGMGMEDPLSQIDPQTLSLLLQMLLGGGQ